MKIILISFRWAHSSVYGPADLCRALHGIRNRHAESSQAAVSQFQSAKITCVLILASTLRAILLLPAAAPGAGHKGCKPPAATEAKGILQTERWK